MRALSRRRARTRRDAVADLSAVAYGGAVGEDLRDREVFLEQFTIDTARPGFTMVAVGEAGCAYGSALDPEGDWWRGYFGEPPNQIKELISRERAFAVIGLMPQPDCRRRGVASRMMGHLLTRCGADLVAAFAEATNIPAHNAFVGWGWTRTGSLRTDATSPVRGVWTHPVQPNKPPPDQHANRKAVSR
ncbi:GNAT family N-acetyltransferase [Streptodolium elevatio]